MLYTSSLGRSIEKDSSVTTAADAIIRQLIEQERVIVSPWRALVLLRRATRELPPSAREWSRMPRRVADIMPLLAQMQRQGQVAPIAGHRGVFRLAVPEARVHWVDEQELLFELMPHAVLSHRSAMIHHGLTTLRPSVFTVTVPRQRLPDVYPVGTGATDWAGLSLPGSHHPTTVNGIPVRVRTVVPEHLFGFIDDDLRGTPVRVTSVERTLVDGLLAPDLCDGIDSVLESWAVARYDLGLDVNQVVEIVERVDVGVLQQRVGFVLEQLGMDHPRLAQWRAESQRGGSSRLVPNAPYADRIDKRWNLSLNGPTGALDLAA